VQLSSAKIKKRCAQRRVSLGDVLKQAGVSRTAYYSLVRKESVLPKSILRMARHLGVTPSALLDNKSVAKALIAKQPRLAKVRTGKLN
jgi:transcriptional regulator with XRE-family HTH domain